MRTLFSLLAALPLTAAWNFNILSGSHGAIAVSRLVGSVLTPETILATATPSRIALKIGASGTAMITYWNGKFHWFAMSVPTGICGPAANWRCGSVRVPTGVTGVDPERIVGGYALRPINANVPAGLYSTSRSPQNVWTTPFSSFNYPDHSPTSRGVGNGWARFGAAAPNTSVEVGELNQTSFSQFKSLPGGPASYGMFSGGAYCSADSELALHSTPAKRRLECR